MGGGGEMLVCSSVGLTRIRGSAAATLQGPIWGRFGVLLTTPLPALVRVYCRLSLMCVACR